MQGIKGFHVGRKGFHRSALDPRVELHKFDLGKHALEGFHKVEVVPFVQETYQAIPPQDTTTLDLKKLARADTIAGLYLAVG